MVSIAQKVVFLGEGCVGKTSIVARYMGNNFNDKHVKTQQAAYFEKNINVDGKRLKLLIWDTAGQEQYHALGPIYYRDSRGAILVYDITDKDSFDRVRHWVIELRRALGTDCILVIVGNKIDMDKDRKVTEKEAIEYSRTVGALHLMTSAKMNKGVQELFLTVTKCLVKKLEEESKSNVKPGPNTRSGNTIKIVDDEKKPKSSCC